MTNNAEQLEAKEIDTRPRIVITANTFFVFPDRDSEIALTQDQLIAVGVLMNALKNQAKH